MNLVTESIEEMSTYLGGCIQFYDDSETQKYAEKGFNWNRTFEIDHIHNHGIGLVPF